VTLKKKALLVASAFAVSIMLGLDLRAGDIRGAVFGLVMWGRDLPQ